MDMTKELYPDPSENHFVERGMNILCMDGPGQGESNLRKTRVTADNYERAASAVVSYLSNRPEVDPDRKGVVGISMGSYWGCRLATMDSRVKALATGAACHGGKNANGHNRKLLVPHRSGAGTYV
jgi:dienelactone hydrolase